MKQRLVFIAATCAAMPPIVSAQEMTLDPVVVTASRTAQTADETLAPVTVITREQIERQQPLSVIELLRGQPGITMTNNGGLGKKSSLFLRGTKSDHVLVLVDGIKVGSATDGAFTWQDLPPEQIERIEIVRGPRSALYGSEAVGGVIQIFTRRGGGELTPSASFGYGSNETHKTTLGVSGGGDNSWFNLSASHFESDGYDACDNDLNGGCYAIEPDDDGYRRTAVNMRVGTRFEGGEAEASFLQSKGYNEYDGYWNSNDFTQRVAGARLMLTPSDNWASTLLIGRSWDDSDNYSDGVFQGFYETQRDTASWLNDLALGNDHDLSLGVDYQRDELSSNTAYDGTRRDNVGVFARYYGEFGSHDVELALRHDDNEQFGGHTTGSVAWGRSLGANLRLLASYGTSFKAPTFNHLYFPGSSNPDLAPEEAGTLDIGLQGRLTNGHWSAHVFETKIDELIVSSPPLYVPYNVEEARIRGLELAGGVMMADWNLDLSITLLDPENRSAGSRGEQLPLRTRRSARLDVYRAFGRINIGGTWLAESDRPDPNSRTGNLGGYGTLDLRVGYRLKPAWTIQAEVSNVFDKEYETAGYYNQAGREYFVNLRYAPQR